MISKELIDRINALSKKSKTEGLTESEKNEQASLRKQYLGAFKKNFEQQLQSIEFIDDKSSNSAN